MHLRKDLMKTHCGSTSKSFLSLQTILSIFPNFPVIIIINMVEQNSDVITQKDSLNNYIYIYGVTMARVLFAASETHIESY